MVFKFSSLSWQDQTHFSKSLIFIRKSFSLKISTLLQILSNLMTLVTFLKNYQGNYPEWDEHHPIHFVTHSAGVQVEFKFKVWLVVLLGIQVVDNTSENWVLIISPLSGAFNGTTRTYLDGMQPMKPICLLQLCRLGPFASGDWILPDLTIQGSTRLNSHLRTFPNTYYFSYATKKTRNLMGITLPSSILGIHPRLFIRVLQMSQWTHPPDALLPYKGYRDEDWQDNDRALSTISMTYPRLPTEHPNKFVENGSDFQPLQPGMWYHKIVEVDLILFFIVNRERAGVQFDLIYNSIFERCRKHVLRTRPTLPNQIQH
ncbi:hypothetical protein MKW98_017818 [Papaver atlanticum]|uniref:Uncharacterized protein n=1 Tax=Papaver atlanticum TaxID=357466 RepID=A0AAD4XVT2_9MAGN|nr:hypothetical protein MKW98_017818 [Papaver atlanticum]